MSQAVTVNNFVITDLSLLKSVCAGLKLSMSGSTEDESLQYISGATEPITVKAVDNGYVLVADLYYDRDVVNAIRREYTLALIKKVLPKINGSIQSTKQLSDGLQIKVAIG